MMQRKDIVFMASLVEQYGWNEWICHTNFSFLIGASHPRDIIDRAIDCNYRSLAITDYDGVYGIARAYRELQSRHKNNKSHALALHYGAEIHLSQDHQVPCYFQDTLILLALSHQGYQHLCDLLTLAHCQSKHNAVLSLKMLLSQPVNDIVAIQPMRGGIRCEQYSTQALFQRCGNLRDHFEQRFYFAISRHLNPVEDQWIIPTLNLAKTLKSPILFSQDIYFHAKSQKRLSDLLQGIRHNETIDTSAPHLFINSQRYPHSLVALEKLYSSMPGYEIALRASKQLAEQFHFDLNELRYQYPKEMIPPGITAQAYLEQLVWQYATAFYGSPLPDKIRDLLQHEIALVSQLNFADYFLTVYDIVTWARSQHILCQGRGSAANSAICFVLGITSVNPNHFDLLFERFISVERGDPPDIDVDFEHERREEVIQYIYCRYGRTRAAMVANVICFQPRGAIRATGKALGIPERLLDKAATILETDFHHHTSPTEIIKVIAHEESDNSSNDSSYLYTLWAELSEQLIGFPRHLGIHSGGFVLSDQALSRLCPQEPATMAGRTVITWCKEDIEGLGFFKIDILALGGLTLLRKSFDLLQSHYGILLNFASIPADDPKTYAMIQAADTVGTFQIESRAQMAFLPKHKPRNFYDLVVQVAIIRPGPIQGGIIHPYLRRRAGQEPVLFPDERLVPILKRTYGVPIFQEQVMRVAIAVGQFTPGEADELRKNIGAFSLRPDQLTWVKKLIEGMRANHIEESFIQGMVEHIKGFASYGFPESHAASFALIAYATAYLKCHYPAVFFTAILNSLPMGFYSHDVLIKTALQAGVKVLPICVNYSTWDHRLEWHEEIGIGYGYAIRLGCRLVNGLSEKGISRFVQKREVQGQWTTLEIFLKDNSLSRVDLTSLAAANALSCFGITRKDALWLAEAAPYNEWIVAEEPLVYFPCETELDSIQLDYIATQTSLGKHPTELMKVHAWQYDVPLSVLVRAADIKQDRQVDQVIIVFGMVSCRQAPPTAKGMVFITLWDETGSCDVVVQPLIFECYHALINRQSFLCVSGKVQCNDGAYSLLVQRVYSPTKEPVSSMRLSLKNVENWKSKTSRNYR